MNFLIMQFLPRHCFLILELIFFELVSHYQEMLVVYQVIPKKKYYIEQEVLKILDTPHRLLSGASERLQKAKLTFCFSLTFPYFGKKSLKSLFMIRDEVL